jgi:hypothetical protein
MTDRMDASTARPFSALPGSEYDLPGMSGPQRSAPDYEEDTETAMNKAQYGPSSLATVRTFLRVGT